MAGLPQDRPLTGPTVMADLRAAANLQPEALRPMFHAIINTAEVESRRNDAMEPRLAEVERLLAMEAGRWVDNETFHLTLQQELGALRETQRKSDLAFGALPQAFQALQGELAQMRADAGTAASSGAISPQAAADMTELKKKYAELNDKFVELSTHLAQVPPPGL